VTLDLLNRATGISGFPDLTATDTASPIHNPESTVYTVLFAVAACHMMNDTLQALMLSIYPMLRDSYAVTFGQVGVMTMVFQVTASILQPLIGHYTDRRPLPYSLPVAPICMLVGLVLLGLAIRHGAIAVSGRRESGNCGRASFGSGHCHPARAKKRHLVWPDFPDRNRDIGLHRALVWRASQRQVFGARLNRCDTRAQPDTGPSVDCHPHGADVFEVRLHVELPQLLYALSH
jgi:hypothetical protein